MVDRSHKKRQTEGWKIRRWNRQKKTDKATHEHTGKTVLVKVRNDTEMRMHSKPNPWDLLGGKTDVKEERRLKMKYRQEPHIAKG